MSDNQLQKLFDSFPRPIRGQILEEAGLTDYGVAGDIDVGKDPDRILASILWRRAITDNELAVIIRECGIPIFTGTSPAEITLKVSFSDPSKPAGDGLPITELAAATVFVWEVSVRLAEVFSVLAPEDSNACAPPMVSQVTPGSVSYVLGGALIPTGLAFMVAACGHSIPVDAQQVAYWGGAFIASLGVVTLALGWDKTRAETSNLKRLGAHMPESTS